MGACSERDRVNYNSSRREVIRRQSSPCNRKNTLNGGGDTLNRSDLSAMPINSLERFVYADVAHEPNGMALSVLSALARRGLDPWQEARRLAELPAPAAVDRLAHTLVGLPLMRSSLDDATTVARRLVTLLPPAPGVASASFDTSNIANSVAAAPRWMMLGMAAALVGGLMMPFIQKREAPTVAPASWVTSGPVEPAKPNSAPTHEPAAPPSSAHASGVGHAPTSTPSTPSLP